MHIENLFTKPGTYAASISDRASKCTYGESLLARVSYLAQFILSAIALPALLLRGLIAAGIDLCQGRSATQTLASTALDLKLHLCVGIPISFLGIFAPLATTAKERESLAACIY